MSFNLSGLKTLSLMLMLPGLGGLILSTSISTHYMTTLPRLPDPQHLRMVLRTINGAVVYQTDAEARRLDLIEYTSVGILLVGLSTGLVYLRKWGIARAIESGDEELLTE